MGVTQYTGARYVPLFAEPAEWNSTRTYEPLTIVIHEGNSYTSRQYVPKGIDIANEKFWVLTGNYNAQVEQYRKEVSQLDTEVSQLDTEVSQLDTEVSQLDTEVSQLDTEVSQLDTEVSQLDAEVSQLDTEVSQLDAQMSATKDSELKSMIEGCVRYYDNVSSMVEDEKHLKSGMIVRTNSYHTAGDGGGASYIISNNNNPNDMDKIAIGALQANLVIESYSTYEQFGAYGDGINDDSACIQRAFEIANCIRVLSKTYKVDTEITSTRSVNVLQSPDTNYTAPRNMPTTVTNSNHQLLNNYFISNPTKGEKSYGDSTISAEVVAKSDYVGNAVSGFFGATTEDNANCNIWGLNPIVRARSGYTGIAHGIEIDVDGLSDNNANKAIGCEVTGLGEFNDSNGVWVTRADDSRWTAGFMVNRCKTGFRIQDCSEAGLWFADAKHNSIIMQTATDSDTAQVIAVYDSNIKTLRMGVSASGNITGNVVKPQKYAIAKNSTQYLNYFVYSIPDVVMPTLAPGATADVEIKNVETVTRFQYSTASIYNLPSGVIYCYTVNASKPTIRFYNTTSSTINSVALSCVFEKRIYE